MFGGNAHGTSPTPGLQNNQPQILDQTGDNHSLSGLTLRQWSLRPKTAPGRLHPLPDKVKASDNAAMTKVVGGGCPEGTVCEGSDCAAPPERCVG